MVTIDNIDEFKGYATEAFKDLPSKFKLYESAPNVLEQRHQVRFGAHKIFISLFLNRPARRIAIFRYHIGPSLIFAGEFRVGSSTFSIVRVGKSGLSAIKSQEELEKWENITKFISKQFAQYSGDFTLTTSKPWVAPVVNYSESDIIAALEKSFTMYSTAQDFKEKESALVVQHNSLKVTLLYSPLGAEHGTIQVFLDHIEESFEKEIYYYQYSLAHNKDLLSRGLKPAGFDEGFAKFRLLSALMN